MGKFKEDECARSLPPGIMNGVKYYGLFGHTRSSTLSLLLQILCIIMRMKVSSWQNIRGVLQALLHEIWEVLDHFSRP